MDDLKSQEALPCVWFWNPHQVCIWPPKAMTQCHVRLVGCSLVSIDFVGVEED